MRSRLALRSSYSLLYGVRKPIEIIQRAATYGAKVISITDKDNLYGVHTIIEAAEEAGLRPLIGVELCAPAKLGDPGGSVFAFVRDRRGFARLCEILSAKKREPSFKLLDALKVDAGGLVLASTSASLLEQLASRVPSLYAALSPDSLGALHTAHSLGLPLLALDGASFLEDADEEVHRVLRAVALAKTIGSLQAGDCATPGEERFLNTTEFQRRLSSWPEALRNTNRIAEECTFKNIFDGFIFPSYQADSEISPIALLKSRVLDGAEKRYGELSDGVMERINYELSIIDSKGFAPYFLVMDDIVCMSSRTCGRGSAAASIVSYSLGITNVDPIEHRLYFERFLNPARPDPPDIDVDFAWDERDELIKKVIERFGPERCARVANHNFFRHRSALRETAKAYGLSEGEIGRMERSLFDLRNGSEVTDDLWRQILSIAARIEGLPRGLSMHCGGLVMSPGPLSSYAPIETSVDGYPLLSWEKEGTEAAGLVKIDLLGNRSLAVIRDTLKNIENEGIHIDPYLWRPTEDEATIAALARGDSMGVFYIESPAMRQLQKKTGKGDFAHIVIHSSIIRPAANKFINEYIRRLKGGHWKPLHPRLARILDETYGILCYQEDVSKTAIALASFDEAQADKLRKVIAKKAGAEKLALYEERFFSGCRENLIAEQTIKDVWAMMLSFDGYSFCKPHSASYAMVSFQSAYLRVHHGAAFMAAVLSNQGGYYRPQAYISEARRMGLSIVGPDINRSALKYRGEGDSLIIGFMAIAKLSTKAIQAILAERSLRGPFTSLADFSRRLKGRRHLKVGREDIVSLVASGSCDSLARLSRALIIRSLLGSSYEGEDAEQDQLFAAEPPAITPYGRQQKKSPLHTKTDPELRDEYASLSFLRDQHPLRLWASKLAGLKRLYASDLDQHIGELVSLIGWPITQKEVWTAQGLTMNFVSFEDESGMFETVLFPQVYERHRNLLFDQQPLRIFGRAVNDQGALSVEVEKLGALA